MQAVILAAGRGTRMGELTETVPKPLLEVNGKTLLEHEFDVLPENVDEVVLVVGYLGSVIQQRYGGLYSGKRILYVEQETLDGTAAALWRAKDILEERFIVMMSDDLYGRDDINKCLEKDDWVTLVQKRGAIRSKGKVEVDEHNLILRITEGNHGDIPGLLGTNFFVLDTRLFEYPMVPKSEGSNEYGLPQTIIAASEKSGIPFYAIEGTSWFEITDPEDLKKAEEFLAEQAT